MGDLHVEILQNGDGDKPVKTMRSKINNLAELLQLPMQVHENIHRTLRRVGKKPDNKDYFVETKIGENIYFMHARSPVDGRKIMEIVGDTPPILNIVTGPCLFGGETALAIGESGETFSLTDPRNGTEERKSQKITQEINRLQIDNNLSMYEVESLTRFSLLIQTLAKDCPYVRTIFLNIPHVEYYLYILDAFQQGFISPKLASDWFDAVDKRSLMLTSKMRNRIARHISEDIKILRDVPLESIGQYIRDVVSKEEHPDLNHVLDMLKNHSEFSELWTDIIDLAPPKNWQDLNNLGYVFSELQAGKSLRSDPHLTIALAVENQTEMKIFNQAENILRELPQRENHYNVIPMCSHETVVPTGKNLGENLYFAEEVSSRRENLYAILEANRKRNKQL